MIGIYKITSPSGKIYVGQSTNIERRFEDYKTIINSKQQRRLYHSLNKYGYDKHLFEVLEECSEENLNIRERHYQDLYDCIGKNGLNCRLTTTSDKSGFLSKETRDKMSKSQKGVSRNKGRTFSDEHRANLSKAHLGLNTKLILHLETGIFYSGAKEAAAAYNLHPGSLTNKLSGNCRNTSQLIRV